MTSQWLIARVSYVCVWFVLSFLLWTYLIIRRRGCCDGVLARLLSAGHSFPVLSPPLSPDVYLVARVADHRGRSRPGQAVLRVGNIGPCRVRSS